MKRIIWPVILILLIIGFIRRCTYQENSDRFFVKDKQGRSLILHGVNVNADAKSDPLRVGWPKEQDYANLSQKWGFNFVRMLVLWDGIEPEKGKYDTSYFKRIRERLDWCLKYNLKVVLDMHQDLYALRYGGDGAPEWAIINEGKPFELQQPWELNYRQPAVIASINNFWDLTRGHEYIQEHYIKAFVELVKQFKNHPAVIGYDLYNEPTMATSEFLSFEKKYLTPFYNKLIKAIRNVDNDNWIFFEPTALGPNQGLKTGLGEIKDYRKGKQRLVYFPHLYTIDLDIMNQYIKFPVFINLWAASRNIEINRFKTPLMIGEFGLDLTRGDAINFLKKTMEMFDKISSGWAYWAYMKNDNWSPFNDKKLSPFSEYDPNSDAQKLLVRPYPLCVAGHPESYGFNEEEKLFWLEFEPDANIKAPTEIYLPLEDYAKGWKFNINIDSNLISKTWNKEKRILQITVYQKDKYDVKITITPIK